MPLSEDLRTDLLGRWQSVRILCMKGCRLAGADMQKYGHMRLRELLRKEEFPGNMRHAPLVAQFSSMGSITPKWLEEFQHSLSQGSSHDPEQPARESFPRTPGTVQGLCCTNLHSDAAYAWVAVWPSTACTCSHTASVCSRLAR